MLISFSALSNIDINTLININTNTLTFFSNGVQIISDKNGIVIKNDDGEVIKNSRRVSEIIENLNNSMITNQVKADELSKIDFNKVIMTRSDNMPLIAGSELTLLYDNYGKLIESLDSLGERKSFFYDNSGNIIKTESSTYGTIYKTQDKSTVIIESHNGEVRKVSASGK